MNRLQVLGNITRDIEIRYTNSGLAIASFGIAVNERVKTESGGYDDKAHFFNVTAFGKKAETLNQHFRKGKRILIDGALSYSAWTANDGTKRSEVSIKLNDFDFIDRKDDNGQGGNYQSNNGGGYNTPQEPENNVPEIDINEDEIPF